VSVVHGVRVNARRAIAAALVGVAGAVGAVMLVLSLAGSSDSIEARLGDDDFRGIDAADLADEIADHGPVPFPDLLGRDRSIWVTHAGSDPAIGWYAFLARTPKGTGASSSGTPMRPASWTRATLRPPTRPTGRASNSCGGRWWTGSCGY